MSEDTKIAGAFEESFLSVPLETQILHCDHYELANLFGSVLPAHQPILEAGCGSGRWVGWFVRKGWQASGVDWSEALCASARSAIPEGEFVAADIAEMPFENASFGSIVALGSIEHKSEGPAAILKEFHRLLRPDGVAIVTVPYLGPLRRTRRALRRLMGKADERLVRAPAPHDGKWAADYHHDDDGWSFFQYLFNKRQMRQLIEESGFVVEREFVDFKDEGVLHVLGRLAGSYDYAAGHVRLNAMGRLCKAAVPVGAIGHMLCYQLRKTG